MEETTSWDIILNRFYKKLEKDEEFFNYYNVSEEQAIELAKQRAEGYLTEVADELYLLTPTPYVNLSDYDDVLRVFNFKMYPSDINLIVELMFTKYMEKDLAKLHAFEINFTPSDLQVFSPANERTSYRNLIEQLHTKNAITIDNYKSHNRKTGELIKIDYSLYES